MVNRSSSRFRVRRTRSSIAPISSSLAVNSALSNSGDRRLPVTGRPGGSSSISPCFPTMPLRNSIDET